MQKKWGSAVYSTTVTSDNAEGWTAIQLQATERGSPTPVARVVFWDAEGQFTLELSAPELPLAIVEELIAEAKALIVTR